MDRFTGVRYNTCSVKILSGIAAALEHNPGCTLDVFNMVLWVAVNYNKNRLLPSGATLRFSTFLKLTGCAAGTGFTLMYWRSYKQATPLE